MKENAILIAEGMLDQPYGKTSHGLIRGSSRYKIVAVIDSKFAGRDAGEVLDGKPRNIPVFSSVPEVLGKIREKITVCIIGVATKGGKIPPPLKSIVLESIHAGCSVVNGLHEYLQDDPEFVSAAKKTDAQLIDIRKPKPKTELHFWTGEIKNVKIPRIAVLGTDCAIGKRTTAKMLTDACNDRGIKSEMIFTGQTGWLQGFRYGFIFDTTINDFISGEIEHAIVNCAREANPDLMFIEGQSSLRNPSGPCGSEFILSGEAKGVILQHAYGRKYFNGFADKEIEIPPIQEEIALLKMYGAETLAVTLNGSSCTPEELKEGQQKMAASLGIPVIRPLEEGVDSLLPLIMEFIEKNKIADGL